MHAVRLTNFVANALTVLAVGVLLVAALVWVFRRPYFLIERVLLESAASGSLQYVQVEDISSAINGKQIGGFFDVDLDGVRSSFEQVPWVRRAEVKREWPNQLRVSIEEQEPLAFWNDEQMINRWGEVFTADKTQLLAKGGAEHLPQLNGPDNSERLVIQRYAEVAQRFAPTGLTIRQVTLSPRYAWDVVLSDGLQVLIGRDPAAEATGPHGRSGAQSFASRLERFLHAWPTLTQRLAGRTIARADLRYNDGFAITLAPLPNSE